MKSKILIATKNKDKFYIVSDMFKNLGFIDFEFVSLLDLKITQDIKESGSILARAKQKASFYQGMVQKKHISDVMAVMGIDDGVKLLNRKATYRNSKHITDEILSGKLISMGEVVTIIRAFALNSTDGKKCAVCVTNIPFIFLGNGENIKRIEGSYPLSYVFGLLNSKKSIIETSDKKCLEYYLKYSKKELTQLFKNFSNKQECNEIMHEKRKMSEA